MCLLFIKIKKKLILRLDGKKILINSNIIIIIFFLFFIIYQPL